MKAITFTEGRAKRRHLGDVRRLWPPREENGERLEKQHEPYEYDYADNMDMIP